MSLTLHPRHPSHRATRARGRGRAAAILAAAAAVTCAALLAPTARASLVIDVEALTLNGVPVSDPKNVRLQAPGDVLTFRLIATVTGADANGANDGFQSAQGSLLTMGPLAGNISPITLTAPFNGAGSQAGTQQDLDSDGDLDVGSNNNAAGTGFINTRAASMQTGGTPAANGQSFVIATSSFTLTSSAAATAALNFRTRTGAAGAATWQEDGGVRSAINGTYTIGSALNLTLTGNVVWSGGAGGSGTAWLTASNWSGGVLPSATDVAEFSAAGSSGSVAINFSASTNNGSANQIVGAVMLNASAGRNLTISNSSSVANGTLTLQGKAGLLLDNQASSFTLTLQDGATRAMAVAVPNSGAVNAGAGATIVVASAIAGAGAITKTGAGTLTFSGPAANSYTGATTVSAGTLRLAKPSGVNALAGNVTVNSGGTLLWQASEQIANAATLTLNSGGTINLNGHTETVAAFVDNGGTTILGGGNLIVDTGDITLTDGTNLAANSSLAGSLIYNGTTTAATVSGNLALADGGHTFNIADGSADADVVISGVVSGFASITKTGGGTLLLSGSNTYTNLTNINAGRVRIAADANLGTSGITLGGGTLEITTGGAYSRPMSTNSSTGGVSIAAGQTVTFAGQISGAGAVNVSGGGTLNPAGSNVHTGKYAVTGGSTLKYTLAAGQGNAPGADTADYFTLNSGTLAFEGRSSGGVSTVAATKGITLSAGGGTIAIDPGALASYSVSYAGVITGAGALVKDGAGELVLSGAAANINTGVTTVVGGTLAMGKSAGSAVGGDVAVAAGATLKWLAGNQVADGATVTVSGGTLDLNGNSETVSNLTVTTGNVSGGSVNLAMSVPGIGGNLTLGNGAAVAANVTAAGNISYTGSTAGAEVAGNLSLTRAAATINVADGAADNDVTFSGAISAAGDVSKIGPGTLMVGGPQAWTAGSSLAVNSGSVRLTSNAGGSGQNLAIEAAGGDAWFGASQFLAGVTVAAGRTVAMQLGGSRVLDTVDLSIAAGGTLDLADNKLIVRYAGGTGGATLEALGARLRSGLNEAGGGYWNGAGIVSSVAAADASRTRGYALIDSGDPVLGGTFTTFADRPLDGNALLGMYTYYGDANLDGSITFDDFALFDTFLGTTGGGWLHGDFNYDGTIDRDNDFALMMDGFYNQGTPMPDEIAVLVERIQSKVVPEPGGVGFAAAMAVGALVQRPARRRPHASVTAAVKAGASAGAQGAFERAEVAR